MFVWWHINFLGLFNAKYILPEEQLWYYLTHSWEDKKIHTFLKSICSKVNVLVQLEFELIYYDSAVQHFNHYTTRTPLISCTITKKHQLMLLYSCMVMQEMREREQRRGLTDQDIILPAWKAGIEKMIRKQQENQQKGGIYIQES